MSPKFYISPFMDLVYKRNFPTGMAWTIDEEEDTEKLLHGIASYEDEMRLFNRKLANLRNPQKTILLEELEREYGFILKSNLSEDERRTQIQVFKTNKREANGGLDFLQKKLHDNGFTNVFVFNNDPPVNPEGLLRDNYTAWCGYENSYCGNPESFCADIEYGDYIVNGPIYKEGIPFIAGCGQDTFCGNEEAYCGNYDFLDEDDEIRYSILIDEEGAGGWALVFFIAAGVTRDPITNEIIALEPAYVDKKQEITFKKIVLRHKPAQTWAANAVKFIDDIDFGGFGTNAFGNSAFGN